MLDFHENFKNKNEDKMCKLCAKHIDSQDMIESCQVLNRKYSNLEDIKKIYTSKFDRNNLNILQKVMLERKTLLNN